MATPRPLSFPSTTFAALTPGAYLAAHLATQPPTRPSGRRPSQFRTPQIHTSSLSHTSGSAVLRLGNTSVVAGIRPEILLAKDVPDLPPTPTLEGLGLLVPNVELSTGSSPNNLPGQAPGPLAQALTQRLATALYGTNIITEEELRITGEETDDEGTRTVTKAWWALYIDVVVLGHDGGLFDAVWGAVVAALADTRLPQALWDADYERVLCEGSRDKARSLTLQERPTAASWAVFSTANALRGEEGRAWTLADPDLMEEDVSGETVTILVAEKGEVLRIEKNGGTGIGPAQMRELIAEAGKRTAEWRDAMGVNGA